MVRTTRIAVSIVALAAGALVGLLSGAASHPRPVAADPALLED
jgi:hypothetical protein